MKPRSLGLVLLLLGVTGCSSALVGVARNRPDGELLLALRNVGPRLSVSEARAVARARVQRVFDEPPSDEGVAFVDAVAPCAGSIAGMLRARSEIADVVGARAALVTLDANLVDPTSHVRSFASDDPSWRAVGARAMVLPESQAGAAPCEANWGPCDRDARRGVTIARWRRAAILDPHVEVRRAGLEAAIDAEDPLDLPALVDAARRDPDPLARLLAIDAIGALGSVDGVLALQDLWPQANEDERIAVVESWHEVRLAAPDARGIATDKARSSVETPEMVALVMLARAVDADVGRPSILAAAGILSAPTTHEGGLVQAASEGRAIALLVRRTTTGPISDRLFAIDEPPSAVAPLVAAWREAAKDADAELATAALTRLVEPSPLVPPVEQAAAAEELMRRIDGATPAAARAMAALSGARTPALVAALLRAATSDDPKSRADAATGLVRSGALAEASVLLADADSAVRGAAVCALLTEPVR
jgi:HEAT repeat protein